MTSTWVAAVARRTRDMPGGAEPRDDRAEHEDGGYGEVDPVVATTVADDAECADRQDQEEHGADSGADGEDVVRRCLHGLLLVGALIRCRRWAVVDCVAVAVALGQLPHADHVPNARGAAGQDVGRTCADLMQIAASDAVLVDTVRSATSRADSVGSRRRGHSIRCDRPGTAVTGTPRASLTVVGYAAGAAGREDRPARAGVDRRSRRCAGRRRSGARCRARARCPCRRPWW